MNDLGWDCLDRTTRHEILGGLAKGAALGGPYHLEIHPSDRCNLECSFCSTRWMRHGEELEVDFIPKLIQQIKSLEVRSVSISGGGEPLATRTGLELIRHLSAADLPIAHITTNGLRLDGAHIAALKAAKCQQVRVSLNSADCDDYARLMNADPRVFDRVLRNLRALSTARSNGWRPEVILQFLIDRVNYRSIPKMYDLATSVGADRIVYNGLAYLPEDSRMSSGETREMMELYERVLRLDEYRRVAGISSFEQDISGPLLQIEVKLGEERSRRSRTRRLLDLVKRRDQTWREKWRHRKWMRRRRGAQLLLAQHGEPCLLPWYTLTVRADGSVPVCCVLQHRSIGNVHDSSLTEIWNCEELVGLRRALRASGLGEKVRPSPEKGVECSDDICTLNQGGQFSCPFRGSFYRHDLAFSRQIAAVTSEGRSSSSMDHQ